MSIKKFQKNNGLIADGIVGKNTIAKIKEVYNLSITECAHFLGQIDHETAGFKYSKENLKYSAERLRQIFPKYFPSANFAKKYEYQSEKIANRVYANRMGNGDEQSGDGYKYSGRGSLQLTGKNNYTKFSKYTNNPKIITNPDIVATDYYLDVAIWYFKENNIFQYCKDVSIENIKKVTRKINGGYNGLQHRIERTKYYYNTLKNIEDESKQNSDRSDSTNNSNTSSNTKTEEQQNKANPIPEQDRSYKKRFFNPFIRFLIPKSFSGYFKF